jgi:hypothetical protein
MTTLNVPTRNGFAIYKENDLIHGFAVKLIDDFLNYASVFTDLFELHSPTFSIQTNEMWRYHPITGKEEYGMIYVWKLAKPIAPNDPLWIILKDYTTKVENFYPMNFPSVDWENPREPLLDINLYKDKLIDLYVRKVDPTILNPPPVPADVIPHHPEPAPNDEWPSDPEPSDNDEDDDEVWKSYTSLANHLLEDPTLSMGAKLSLMVIIKHSYQKDHAFPDLVESLAKLMPQFAKCKTLSMNWKLAA